jgi:parallel beta-helix repeat protein
VILIENNKIHDNGKNGINLSRNMRDSIVRENTIYDSPKGIEIHGSRHNEVYGNNIYNVSEGIHYSDVHVSKNKVYNNTISQKIPITAADG